MSAEEASRKPLPAPDADTSAFWRGLHDGKLLLQHCVDCGHVQYYQQATCRTCGRDSGGGAFCFDPWLLYGEGLLDDPNVIVLGKLPSPELLQRIEGSSGP